MRSMQKFFPTKGVRSCVSEGHKQASQDTFSMSWRTIVFFGSTVGLVTGVFGCALGFVSNRAHKDNEITRRELREDMKELRTDMNREIKDLRTDMNREIKDLRMDMNSGFEKLGNAINAAKEQNQPSSFKPK